MTEVTQAPEENAENLETPEIPEGIKVGKVDNSKLDSWNDTEEEVEEEETSEEEPEVEEVEETFTPAEPIITVEDPGEYEPADYSFDVKDAEGKTIKITTVEEADAFADNDDNFQTAKDLKDFIRKSSSMESRLESDKKAFEDKKSKYDEQVTLENTRQAQVEDISKGIDYLVSKSLLPAVDKEYTDKDWNDPEVAKQPGVKEQREVLSYMVKENAIRSKAGLSPMTSVIDAFNAMQIDNARSQGQSNKEKNAEERKAKGAKIASTTSTIATPAPKGISVGRPNAFQNTSQWED